MKKTIGVILILVAVGIAVFGIWALIHSNYEWENSVLSNWSLSDKSSTLQAKSEYMDKFVSALRNGNLADNDALIYKTADNNCDNNVKAVETLRDRLNQIKGMDESSFQYQQAIQQITAQEQGESKELISTLNGCWMKTHHYFIWNIFACLGVFLSIFVIGFLGFLLLLGDEF